MPLLLRTLAARVLGLRSRRIPVFWHYVACGGFVCSFLLLCKIYVFMWL